MQSRFWKTKQIESRKSLNFNTLHLIVSDFTKFRKTHILEVNFLDLGSGLWQLYSRLNLEWWLILDMFWIYNLMSNEYLSNCGVSCLRMRNWMYDEYIPKFMQVSIWIWKSDNWNWNWMYNEYIMQVKFVWIYAKNIALKSKL